MCLSITKDCAPPHSAKAALCHGKVVCFMQESTLRTPHEQACGWRVAAVTDDPDQILELETTTVGVVMAATKWSSPGASSSVDFYLSWADRARKPKMREG